MRFSAALFTGALGVCALPSISNAATTTGSLAVNAVVLKSCSVVATPLAFGNYDPTTSTPTDATTSLVVLCTSGTSFNVGLSAGGGSGATVSSRKMTYGGETLTYGLYQDSGRSTRWGDTVGTDTPAPTTASVLPTTLTVYGRVPASQNAPTGVYADAVTVTVTY